jgi:5'-3' exonuclease
MNPLKILAVDISALFSLYWEVNQGSEREHSQPLLSTLQAVQRYREGFDRVAICCDGGVSWRRSVWPTYKANRPDRGEPYREQIRQTLRRLQEEGCTVIAAPAMEVDGNIDSYFAEADDVIGSLASWAREDGHEVTILTLDKDLCQLITDGVSVLSLSGKEPKLYGAAEVQEKYGVPPERLPDLLALAGDKSDNFKPYEGIGDKTASDLVRYCGSALAVFDAQHFDRLHEYIGNAKAQTIKTGGREPAEKALIVATILRDLAIDFSPLLAEPVYKTADPAAQPSDSAAAPATALAARPSPQAITARPASAPPQLQVIHGGQVSLPYWASKEYLDALWDISRAFHCAGCFGVAKPEQVMVVAMIAHEDGIGIATAMQHAYFVHGRLSWSATYLLMRVQKSGKVERFQVTKIDDKCCVIEAKRRGCPMRIISWEWQEAERAGLTKPSRNGEPSNWVKWPKEMNLARGIARALRQEFRDLIGGRYVPEEMGEKLPEDMILQHARDVREQLPQAA